MTWRDFAGDNGGGETVRPPPPPSDRLSPPPPTPHPLPTHPTPPHSPNKYTYLVLKITSWNLTMFSWSAFLNTAISLCILFKACTECTLSFRMIFTASVLLLLLLVASFTSANCPSPRSSPMV